MSAITPSTMQLNRLKWETTTEYNTGLDASFLKGKLRFTVDVYQKYIKDLLQKKVKMPTSIGYGNGYEVSYMNSGKMTNKGWEFRVDAVPFENRDWRVGFYFNIAHNENKITEMPDNYTEENYTFNNGNMHTVEKKDVRWVLSMVIVTKAFVKIKMPRMHVMPMAT